MKQNKLLNFIFLPLLLMVSACDRNNTTTFQGYVETELVYIASPYSGELEQLNVIRGQSIKKGNLLFQLDPEPEKSQLAEAQRQLDQAKSTLDNLIKGQRQTVLEGIQAQIKQTEANVELAKIRVKRFQALQVKSYVDKDTLDNALANLKFQQELLKQFQANLAEAKLGSRQDLIRAQEAALKAAQAEVTKNTWALAQKSANAPWDGVVFDTFYNPGDWVAAGKPVVALLSPALIRIIFFVPEPLLAKLKLGESVQISCDSCSKSYHATIYYISPEAEYTPPVVYSRDSNYNLVFRIKANPDLKDALELHPGQPVYITIQKTE